MSSKQILFLMLGIDTLILLFQTTELSISYKELSILYGDTTFLQLFINFLLENFAKNDFILRVPMISLHIMSAVLLYKIVSKNMIFQRDRLWLVLLFILLPGVMSSALVVNSAGLVIFGLFLFIYIYQNFNEKYIYLTLIFYSFIEKDFIYLFASLIIYSIYVKDKFFFLLNSSLLIVSFYLYDFSIGGYPSGHFLDTIGIYATVFTPIIFIYIVYVLYKNYLLKNLDIIWFISTTILIYSLLISFRQKIAIEHFAPYLIVSLPLVAQTFVNSYRVRLKIFRKSYKNIFIITFLLLFIHSLTIFFNKEIYPLIENPKKHFAYKIHIAKELAKELKKQNILCVDTDKKMSQRLLFYGIKKCNKNILKEIDLESKIKDSVTVSYTKKIVYRGTVTKLNNKENDLILSLPIEETHK